MRNAVWRGKKPNKNKENLCKEKKYWERGNLKPTTSWTSRQWRSSWKKNLPYKKDMLFTQMFHNLLAQAPPGGSEHNNCCNYSNQIWCERSPLCVTHRSSSREHQLRQGDNQDEHGRYVDNVNKSQILLWYLIHAQKGTISKIKSWL